MNTVLNWSDYTIIGAIMLILRSGWTRWFGNTADNSARIERKLDTILQHLNANSPTADTGSTLSAEAQSFADNGQTINAIKAYRQQTGADLRSAKAAVDTYLATRTIR